MKQLENFRTGIFELSQSDIDTSIMMYNGKIVKCLVAPYHSKAQIEAILDYTPSTFLFPEDEMSHSQTRGFISMIANAEKFNGQEIIIVTASQTIIGDMVDTSVRILTEGGDIVACPSKTFMANIHTIRYDILENKAHQLNDHERKQGQDSVNLLITQVNEGKENGMSEADYNTMVGKIRLIGEPLIGNKLLEMAREIRVNRPEPPRPKKSKAQLDKEMAAALASENYEKAAEIKKDLDAL